MVQLKIVIATHEKFPSPARICGRPPRSVRLRGSWRPSDSDGSLPPRAPHHRPFRGRVWTPLSTTSPSFCFRTAPAGRLRQGALLQRTPAWTRPPANAVSRRGHSPAGTQNRVPLIWRRWCAAWDGNELHPPLQGCRDKLYSKRSYQPCHWKQQSFS